MNLTFPHMGNTYIIVKTLLDELGVNYVIPPYNNKRALEIGSKYSPEMACLPLKINIGNFVEAYKMGADAIMMTGGCGPCRFGYYCEMHKEILKDIGMDMEVITLEIIGCGIKEFLNRIKKISGTLSPLKIVKAVYNATIIAKHVDALEKLVFKIRARELQRGSVDKIYNNFRKKAVSVNGYKKLMRLISVTKNELMKVEYDNNVKSIKIGIVGEIFTTIDPFSNYSLESKLGNMGVEVDRAVTVSGWIIEHMLKPLLMIPRDTAFKEAAKPYLGAMIGGHAQETIGNTVLYAKNGYDGVIQVYPLTCMPEIVAQGILSSVERDYDIPILTLIIDEMTGEAGYLTRLEAFCDLLEKRRERKIFDENYVLFGN